MFLRFLREQGPKQRILNNYVSWSYADHSYEGMEEEKVLLKLKPTNQAVGMTKKMRRKIKYEK